MQVCLNRLMEEIQQAAAWSRPSILIAVHRSKIDQADAIREMTELLEHSSFVVSQVAPENDSPHILDGIVRRQEKNAVFFIRDLGGHNQVYDGLNMFRELVVEHSLKMVFWLTMDELTLLSHRAPDFWAFRHAVIEFPSSRRSRGNPLPSGTLLWHFESLPAKLDDIHARIHSSGNMLQSLPASMENAANRVQVLGSLVNSYWQLGENNKARALLNQEIEYLDTLDLSALKDMYALILNMKAVISYDEAQYKDSLYWIEKALELCPNRSLFLSNYGVICRSAGRSRDSLPSLKKAIRLEPTSHELHGSLAYVCMSLGKYGEALQQFDRALTLRPDDYRLLPAVAFCRAGNGDSAGFEEVIKRMDDLAGNNDYLSVCRDGLLGKVPAALALLETMVNKGSIPRKFLRRDPNLHFIFDRADLSKLGAASPV